MQKTVIIKNQPHGGAINAPVTRKSDQFDASFFEFWLKFDDFGQLGGANGREIGGMREENRPRTANQLWNEIGPCVVSALKSGNSAPKQASRQSL